MFNRIVRIDNHLYRTIDSYFNRVRFVNNVNNISKNINDVMYSNIINNKNQTENKIIKEPNEPNEKFGIVFEMAICLLYNIKYNGNFKYSIDEANYIKNKIEKLKNIHPFNMEHVARTCDIYDFTSDNIYHNLSAKTNTHNSQRICPQIIGQTTIKKWCEYFEIDPILPVNEIKMYIADNIHKILFKYFQNTFHCPIIYYYKNSKNVKILYIKLKNNIDWNKYDIIFTHIIKNKNWNESTSIKINDTTIGEFQVHNHRNCIKFRWSFMKLLKSFPEHFEIVPI